jgi:hypothetical protein
MQTQACTVRARITLHKVWVVHTFSSVHTTTHTHMHTHTHSHTHTHAHTNAFTCAPTLRSSSSVMVPLPSVSIESNSSLSPLIWSEGRWDAMTCGRAMGDAAQIRREGAGAETLSTPFRACGYACVKRAEEGLLLGQEHTGSGSANAARHAGRLGAPQVGAQPPPACLR